MTARPYDLVPGGFRGRKFDHITMAGVLHWEYCLGKLLHSEHPIVLPIMQGPFSTAVSQSGNTHAGSGAVDTGRGLGATWTQTAWAGRLAGFFASHRTPAQGPWGDHVHAVQLGNTHLSPAAATQVRNYREFDDAGLVGDDRDLMRDVDPLLPFRYPLGKVDLDNVREEFKKTKGWVARPGVKHVQRALNLKTGSMLPVDGIAGPRTRRRLGFWEEQNGGNGDGIPGPLLWLLGASQFELK